MVDHADITTAIRRAARQDAAYVAELAMAICKVPAPTGLELDRSRFVSSVINDLGYAVTGDDVGNVYVRRGTKGGNVLMLAAHLDTVFPADTSLEVERSAGRMSGPGIGDNSLGIAAVIGLFSMLDALQIETSIDLLFVADVGEEGLGNLRGMRTAVERFQDSLAAVVAVEGHNLGRVTHTGVGSVRWRLRSMGPGGHSWGAFGQPSAIHALAAVIADIASIDVPDEPRTTFNVGVISGGTSVNTIAAEAVADLDMRSVDPGSLEQLSAQVRAIIGRYEAPPLRIEIETIGERPAGILDAEHPLVQIACDAVSWAGAEPTLDASSTDANVPLSRG
ncbi:MAG: M20/M25/M40 family metallo-hydrolase, partial [Chloroflexota bacterium]